MTETTTAIAPSPLLLGDGNLARTAWTLSPDILHVNHGSFGAVPLVAQQEQNLLRSEMEAAPVIWFPKLPAMVASTREAIAAFLRADAGDLALVPNASAGASVVYSSLPVTPGLEIVVTDHGYGAVTMGAERLARRWDGTVRTARVPLDATPEEAHDAIVAELGDKTGLIVVDQITSATARFLPVDTVAAVARERGIAMLVDAAHVPGLVADPLAGLDCDFWVGNLHKFGCAPRGTAALIARGPLRDELYPLIDSWGAPQRFPERFDTQGTVDATAYLAAPTALDFIGSTWGWDATRRYLTELADYAEATIAAAFTGLTGEDHRVHPGAQVNALRLVRLPTGLGTSHAEADALRDRVASELGIEAAFTSFAGVGYFRLSTHVYNTPADFEEFADRCVPALVALAARGE
ncbi:aminotransferase class V-fold PLP-dependent enzyme [Lacisediminihabitans sp.]|uniref:aminotransferase class V-fold PLP-dependent enzyme n=1 Tax=Lacisediminihabitans sp. TaxID=2787631 RepID=UPI00374DDB89